MVSTDLQTGSLFDAVEPGPPATMVKSKTSAQLARNFVRWCCSFGGEFRNSPDEKNLRAWAGKEGVSYKSGQETQILKSAREVYLKGIVSSMRKSSATEFTPEGLLPS